MKERPVLFTAEAVADASGVLAIGADACLLVDVAPIDAGELPFLMAVGAAARFHEAVRSGAARRVDRPGSVIIPGLVNAHAHLDLTHIGPRPHDAAEGFVAWVDMVRTSRATTPEGIGESVRRGIQLSRRGGTVAVGDIAGAPGGRPTLVPWEVLRESGMLGVSFVEFFAIGKGAERGAGAVGSVVENYQGGGRIGVKLGLQPHAPTTVGLAGYRRAVELARERGFPLSTHLAETWEEWEFVANARGPQREFLERLGLWDDAMLGEIGRGRHPVEHLREVLGSAPFAVAHVNDADDAAVETLATTGTTVVYCPRASAYFAAERRFGPHRYRDMIAAGVPVALGTDSIVNLDTPGRISVLDEMRLLSRRDGTNPKVLLGMGTVVAARALGMETDWFEFHTHRHRIAGLVAVGMGNPVDKPLNQVMTAASEPELLLDRNYCCEARMEPI